ncbi:amidohydrolase family protein [Umezawaea sp. Da 62-37]|uniref:amidohydrolase family protein n=1 Tax=Umezawaea sp. Da 62-37 TaxID=3075927 RepID=UPI0028F7114F|nr:amidohydrolase family protein [Umezawaea sp. Da 62-37]WNV83007.1 amidohydrolase family protein [Umezawaea sp. Da 62-37]
MSRATVIHDVRVFDGHRLGEPASVVIAGGLIDPNPAPSDAEYVDGTGCTLLPGLLDTHAHVSERAHLEAMATWGVTTALDMAAPRFDATMALKHQPGLPTLRSAGRPAVAPGSTFVTKMGFPPSTAVDGPHDADRFVADRIADGSDHIKIILEDPAMPGARALGQDTVAAIAAAARRTGLVTVAHVVSVSTLRTAVTAGVDVVTHTALTGGLGEQDATMLENSTVVLIPTLTMMDGVVRSIGGRLRMRLLSLVVPAARMHYRHANATVALFHRSGKVVLAGTDANDDPRTPFQVPHGSSLHDELERLVGAGLTPVDALRAATSLAAETFGLTDRGAVLPGRRADLVLVEGDPTRDITATRAIRGVWIGGTRVGGSGGREVR